MKLRDILKWLGLCLVAPAVPGLSFLQEKSQPQSHDQSQSVAIERLRQTLSLDPDHEKIH